MRLAAKRGLKNMFSGKQEHNPHVAHWPGVTVLEDKEERYRTVKKLGDGITATVYEGVSRADGGHYALKCINNKYLKDDDEAVEALRTEVVTLQQLGSRRFIMSLHEVISTPAASILVMELVSGGDLMKPIEEKGPYSERRAQMIFGQCVHAVRHMHSLGIVHRDLKPENICFTTSERRCAALLAQTDNMRRPVFGRTRPFSCRRWIKLIDLGAAGVLRGDEGLSDLHGTPLYVAPEVTPWFWVENAQQAARCGRYGKEVGVARGPHRHFLGATSSPTPPHPHAPTPWPPPSPGPTAAPRAHCRWITGRWASRSS